MEGSGPDSICGCGGFDSNLISFLKKALIRDVFVDLGCLGKSGCLGEGIERDLFSKATGASWAINSFSAALVVDERPFFTVPNDSCAGALTPVELGRAPTTVLLI